MKLTNYLTGLATLALVAGCATQDPFLKTGSDHTMQHDIEVVETTEVFELPVSAAEPGILYYRVSEMEYFLSEYRSRGRRHGPLVVSVPAGSPHAAKYEAIASQAIDIAFENGVRDVKRSDYQSNGSPDAPMVLAFTAYRAIAPDCPSLATINLGGTSTNDPQRAFGCAQIANLAAMVSDPADLLGARRVDPADTIRRAEVLTRYRAGESTATERTESEQGAVSNAVQ